MIVLRNDLDSHIQVSKHFKAHEFTCKCGQCHVSIIDENLILLLETLRKVWGLPISPSSVYRCQQHNRSLENSARYSHHMSGRAADIPLPEDEFNRDSLIALAQAIFPYTYHTDTFLHADVR